MKKILMIVAAALVVACSGGKKESATQSPVTEAVKPAKKVIVARLEVKQGSEQAFIEVAAKLVEATHKEPGNLFYALYQSPLNPVEFIFYEEYKDQAAFDAHASSAYFEAFSEGIKDLAAGPLKVDEY